MSQNRSVRAPKILADATGEPEERFEYEDEVPSFDDLEFEAVEDGEEFPVYGEDDEL